MVMREAITPPNSRSPLLPLNVIVPPVVFEGPALTVKVDALVEPALMMALNVKVVAA